MAQILPWPSTTLRAPITPGEARGDRQATRLRRAGTDRSSRRAVGPVWKPCRREERQARRGLDRLDRRGGSTDVEARPTWRLDRRGGSTDGRLDRRGGSTVERPQRVSRIPAYAAASLAGSCRAVPSSRATSATTTRA